MTVTITRYDQNIKDYVPQGIWQELRLILANGLSEIANTNGYTTGGKLLTNFRFIHSSGTVTVKANNVSWKAVGGTLSANAAYLQFRGNNLVKIDFGVTQSAPANTSIIVQWHSDGLFNFSLL